jgi:(p)ppGpp synthase/HD superfamily hydrolase
MENGMELVTKAKGLAAYAHCYQRYGDRPYTAHLEHTVAVLERFGVTDPEILAAGYLHDALEDTGVGLPRITAALTPRIAAIVDALTDGPGKNRRERKTRPMKLIPGCPGALEVKLADRIANTEDALATGQEGLARMYAKEFTGLAEKLRTPDAPDHIKRMWTYLERLLKGV